MKFSTTDKISDSRFSFVGGSGLAGHTSGRSAETPSWGEDVADADVSGERDEVPSTSVAEADTLAGELKAKVQISRRRPDFTLPRDASRLASVVARAFAGV